MSGGPRRYAYASKAAYLADKAARRERYFKRGRTDDGRPLDDPAYPVWLAQQQSRELVSA